MSGEPQEQLDLSLRQKKKKKKLLLHFRKGREWGINGESKAPVNLLLPYKDKRCSNILKAQEQANKNSLFKEQNIWTWRSADCLFTNQAVA